MSQDKNFIEDMKPRSGCSEALKSMFATSIGGSTGGLDINFLVQYGTTCLGTNQCNGKT